VGLAAGRRPAAAVTRVHADIEALVGLHEALVRFRYAQRGVAERAGDEVELTRASLAAKASECEARLPDAQAAERLERIRVWQQRVDTQASEFAGPAAALGELLDSDLPRAESQLLGSIASLRAARGLAGASGA
jgi:hypothetical protein